MYDSEVHSFVDSRCVSPTLSVESYNPHKGRCLNRYAYSRGAVSHYFFCIVSKTVADVIRKLQSPISPSQESTEESSIRHKQIYDTVVALRVRSPESMESSEDDLAKAARKKRLEEVHEDIRKRQSILAMTEKAMLDPTIASSLPAEIYSFSKKIQLQSR